MSVEETVDNFINNKVCPCCGRPVPRKPDPKGFGRKLAEETMKEAVKKYLD